MSDEPLARVGGLGAIDPVLFEVLRHRLWCIHGELAATIRTMSGSTIASEGGDFNTTLMNAAGDGLLTGLFVTAHATTQPFVVRSILEEYGRAFVRDGDMFLCNDPWRGALHQSDVVCVAPIFVDDELIAWVGSVIHQLDVGGSVHGSFCMGARSVFEEPVPFPPVRIVEGGAIRPDLEAGYLRRSRLPHLMRLDLRAQIGANNVATARIREIADDYGTATLKIAFDAMIELVERKLRARLASLPHVRIRKTILLDDDGVDPDSVYAIVLDLDNTEDRLILDFSESSPQAPALVNCARPALVGGAMAGILPLLCYDLPWTPVGVERCIEIISKPGSICDALWPAGVSGASVAASRCVHMAVASALGTLFELSTSAPERSVGGPPGGMDSTIASGRSLSGSSFHTSISEVGLGGSATAKCDGLDSGGGMTSLCTITPNIETRELRAPILYLFRTEFRDSGGPGRQRGGTGTAAAVQFVGTSGLINVARHGQGHACPTTFGIGGGEPAPPFVSLRITGVAEGDVASYHLLQAKLLDTYARRQIPTVDGGSVPLDGADVTSPAVTVQHLGTKGVLDLEAGDIYCCLGGGGNGHGDPLLRSVGAVIADVEQGFVSEEAARRDYGVEIAPGPDGPVGIRQIFDRPADGDFELTAWSTVDGRRATRIRSVMGGVAVADDLSIDHPDHT